MADGETAWNMTLLFLSMWEYIGKDRVNYSEFVPRRKDYEAQTPKPGFAATAQPLLDVPHDKVTVSEHTFINFIMRAEKYVYITTPYLMCGGEILSALYTAARSGVDVRVITPYVADKKLVKAATESYYRGLLENKVRIFEYIGFIHAKNIIADGTRAMVGTVNLDYRSLYLHHECGICLFGSDGGVVQDIARDFTDTFAQSREVMLSDLDGFSLPKQVFQKFSRLFAPFL
jgi:cardiolipin synthase